MALLEAKNIRKVYATRFGGNQVQALTDVSFTVDEGEYVAIMGESGSGKTTLLNILAALDRPTSGTVLLDGKDISAIRENQLAAFRRDQLGFVFQDFNLLDTFSLKDNILLPLVLQGMNWREMEANLLPIANQLRIANLLEKYPYEVSGGQKQRAAVCRALITHPRLILADEPTGALDYNTGKAVLKLLQDTCRKKGVTVVVITHNQAITAMADRIITVKNGTVTDMCKNEHIVPVEQIEW